VRGRTILLLVFAVICEVLPALAQLEPAAFSCQVERTITSMMQERKLGVVREVSIRDQPFGSSW